MRIYLSIGVTLSVIVSVAFSVLPKCPYGWYPNAKDPSSTSCYLITNRIKRSWRDAQTFCEYMDGSLLKIDSISERTWIFNIIKQYHAGFPSHQEWWIGLLDNPIQTGVIWIDKSVPDQSLLPWAPGEPTHYVHSKACVEYYNGTLRHQDCSTPQYFVCERPQGATVWCDALHGWENINKMCYKIQTKPMTWDDARSACQRYNADLFVGKDRASEIILHNFLESRLTDLWIGLKAYQNASGAVTYRWGSSSGTALQLGSLTDYFGVKHPEQMVTSSNGSVSCVIANHTLTTPKLWQPADCSTRSYSLCQKRQGMCASGWIRNSYYCYNIETRQKLSWTDANSYCEGLGAELLKIRGISGQNFINRNLPDLSTRGIDSIWLGISDNNQDGNNSWSWADNSTIVVSPYMYNNLAGGQLPANRPGQMDCFTIYTADSNGTWQVANNCSETKAFVCTMVIGQKPTSPTAAVTTVSPGVTQATVLWSSECGLFWVKDNVTGYCYQFSDNPMTWFQARAQCEGFGSGSQLASVNTMHDQHFIGDRLFGFQSPGLWIGVNNLNLHSGYHWIDGTPFAYLNWAPGEPNNINQHEHCGEMITGSTKQGMWNDVGCDVQRGYICKKPSPSMTTIATTTLPPTPSGKFYGCPGTLWRPYKGNCFLFIRTRHSWDTASQYCKTKGGNLASIADENEQNYIFSQLPGRIDRSQYWIGFNDMDIQMSFKWSDGSPVQYTNWAENEPNNWQSRQEDCVGILLKDGTWNDYTCENPQSGFICKASKQLIPVGTSQADLGVGCSVSGSLALGYFCYVFQQSSKQWIDAQTSCQANGGYLAVIHDRYQQAFLASQIAGTTGSYWIGLGDGGGYQSQNWVSGDTLDFAAWSANYTTDNSTGNGQTMCVAMKTQGPGVGLWITPDCNSASRYICQYPRSGFSTPLTTTTTAPPTCPDNWHQRNGFCYKGYAHDTDKKTWFEARNFCEAMGADLVSVHSKEEENFAFSYSVLDTWTYSASFWIGLNDFGVEKVYTWTDGSVYRYKNWGPGEPNDASGTDDCVEYNKNPGYWNDNNCYVAKPFVCKIQLGKRLTTIGTTVAPTLPANFNPADNYIGCFKDSTTRDLGSIRYYFTDNTPEKCIATCLPKKYYYAGVQYGDECVCGSYYGNYGPVPESSCNYTCAGNKSQICGGFWANTSCAGSPGWYPYNGSCYYISKKYGTGSKVSWFDARSYCQQHGGDLASVHSEQENGFITTLISKTVNRNCWLGMTDLGVNQFGWVDGSVFDFFAWSQNEPNDKYGEEKCGQMFAYNGYWNDNDCNEEYNFVCKRPQGSVHVHTPAPTRVIVGGCPTGFTGVHNGNKCFKVVGDQQSDRKNYTAARDDCRGKGGDIASINSHLEQVTIINMINGLFNDEIGIWIGLNDRNSNRKYTWQDSSPLVMTNWAKGEPSSYGGDCVEMYSDQRRAGKWHTVSCSVTRGYICEAYRKAAPYQGQCEAGYLQSPQFNCYKVHSSNVSWTQAKSTCESEKSSLVSILSVYDQAFVDIITADFTTPVWIGLADQANTGTYSWVDYWGVYYTSWNKDEPTYTTGEGCVATYKGYWNDTMCAYNYPFVCKKSFFTAPPPTAIPSGYCKDVTWKQFGGYCYHIELSGYHTWADAATACKNLGMELASILSRNEEMFLLREIDNDPRRSKNVWIGFRKTNGFFKWSDGSSPGYLHWDTGEPSDLSNTLHEDCVEMRYTNGKWNDRHCYDFNGYICKTAKLPATSPPPSTTPTTTTSQSSSTIATILPSGFQRITVTVSASAASSSPRVTPSSPVVTPKLASSSKSTIQVPSKSAAKVTTKPALSYTPYKVTPKAQIQDGKQGGDLSSGQIAGIIIGVIIVLILVCAILLFLKNKSGNTLFNFAHLKGNSGFDNACYDKTNEAVTIKSEPDNVNGQVSNGNNLNFTTFSDA